VLEDCGGLDEGGDNDEYGSESDGMVSDDAERSRVGDGEWSVREVMVPALGAGSVEDGQELCTANTCFQKVRPCS
jgi:hypothetical protein